MTTKIVECEPCKGSGKLTYAFGNFASNQKSKGEASCYHCSGLGKIIIKLGSNGYWFHV